ncbi:MAG TPA: TIGR00268 family protein, partial [Chloroflexota bacterium]|nr:TIGR00268 family protein [Chloroflexota bacterium]
MTAGTVADQRLDPEVEASYERLKAICRELGSTLVAFSAGVDSTLLLRVCADELGQRAVAVTAVSESYPSHELAQARRLARDIGARLIL